MIIRLISAIAKPMLDWIQQGWLSQVLRFSFYPELVFLKLEVVIFFSLSSLLPLSQFSFSSSSDKYFPGSGIHAFFPSCHLVKNPIPMVTLNNPNWSSEHLITFWSPPFFSFILFFFLFFSFSFFSPPSLSLAFGCYLRSAFPLVSS